MRKRFVCKIVSRSKDDVELRNMEHTIIESVVSDGQRVLTIADHRFDDSVLHVSQYTLTIDSATMADAGQYTVTVSNQFGKCQCTATLLVQGQPPIIYSTLSLAIVANQAVIAY